MLFDDDFAIKPFRIYAALTGVHGASGQAEEVAI